MSRRFRLLAVLATLCLSLVTSVALAVPVLSVQGVLRNGSGGPAADGNYVLTFGLYADAVAKTALWSEIHVAVPVQGGLFAATLGEQQPNLPIPADLFTNNPQVWVGVKISAEPELPRVRLLPVPYALHAGTASALACTGCIGAGHLDPKVLQPYAKTAELAPVALSGKYADLQGGPDLAPYAQVGAGNTFTKPQTFAAGAGFGKSPAGGCVLDVGTDDGSACVDGGKALWPRNAVNANQMDQYAAPGQLVYRVDENALYLRVGTAWRKLSFAAVCGDGFLDAPEQCDDGKANADAPDKCRLTCQKPKCGDSIQDQGEACDDGNPVTTDACIGCVVAKCGDGFVFVGTEECDDGAGNANAPDKCRTSCKKPACGDGIQDGSEACDDGNLKDGDGCSAACQSEIKVNAQFTNCGASGLAGPNQSQCNSAYPVGHALHGLVTVNGGIQTFVVPADGNYEIEAFGARGGNAPGYAGGSGARLKGTFALKKGDVLQVLVGHMGGDSQSSGGGGGSFVAKGAVLASATPLLVAGGGGGGRSSSYVGVGAPGTTAINGTASAYAGGTNGNGGQRNTGTVGGFAGGGYYTDGLQNASNSGKSGFAFIKGGGGGQRQDNGANLCADGGFGGGGGGMHNQNQGSGGGGGYSGGGAGHDSSGPGWGGGGGSFNGGSSQDNTSGANAGFGKVNLKLL